MRKAFNETVERGRILSGPYGSNKGDKNGAYRIKRRGCTFAIISSDGLGWEHVSMSILHHKSKTPSWDEMCWLKDLFFDKDETVVQYHPAESNYVNMHPGTLHLWRPITEELPTPPPVLVGVGRKADVTPSRE